MNLIPYDVDTLIKRQGASTKKMRDAFIARLDLDEYKDTESDRLKIVLLWVWFAQGWMDRSESK